MKNIIYKFYIFMQGRNGVDELLKFNLIIYLILAIINVFLNNKIIFVMETVLLIIIFYRYLSKNIYRRKKENKIYLRIKSMMNKKIELIRRKWNDRNTHIYKKCSKCKTILRLPLKKGKHTCKCPNCGHKFKVNCYRHEKIKVEVIKNK